MSRCIARTACQLALIQDLLHGVISGRSRGLVDDQRHGGWTRAACTIVIVAARCHLGHRDHPKRVHEAALAADVLILMCSIRRHEQLLLVLHVRLVQSIVGLLRR